MTPEQIRQSITERMNTACDHYIGRKSTDKLREQILREFQLTLDRFYGPGVCTADSMTELGVITVTFRNPMVFEIPLGVLPK